jgi:hypothetical protein
MFDHLPDLEFRGTAYLHYKLTPCIRNWWKADEKSTAFNSILEKRHLQRTGVRALSWFDAARQLSSDLQSTGESPTKEKLNG